MADETPSFPRGLLIAAGVVLVVVLAGISFRYDSHPAAEQQTSTRAEESPQRFGSRVAKIGRIDVDSQNTREPAGAKSKLRGTGNRLTTAALDARAPSGGLASNVSAGDYMQADPDPAYDTTDSRHERWEKRGLTVVPIHIVDMTSQPLEGVRAIVDGIHQGQGGRSTGHGSWDNNRFGPPPQAITDSAGRAELASPSIISDLAEATGISFTISKAGYATRRVLNYPVDGRVRDEVLKKGSSVTVGAYLDTPDRPLTGFVIELGLSETVKPSDWAQLPDGRQRTDALPPGRHALTVSYTAPDGQKWVSEVTSFESKEGDDLELKIQLKTGLTLRGKLSDNVPRPVSNGKVMVAAMYPPPNSPEAQRGGPRTFTTVQADVLSDGTFEVKGLPEGQGEIIGVCDNFVAAHRTLAAQAYQQNQIYTLDRNAPPDAPPFVLNMEPSGGLHLRVLDNVGNPIAGATVTASPNVYWAVGVSSIYLDNKYYMAVTDGSGWALLKNLRAENQPFTISAQGWVVPATVNAQGEATRDMRASILAGLNTELTVKLEPAPKDDTARPSP